MTKVVLYYKTVIKKKKEEEKEREREIKHLAGLIMFISPVRYCNTLHTDSFGTCRNLMWFCN